MSPIFVVSKMLKLWIFQISYVWCDVRREICFHVLPRWNTKTSSCLVPNHCLGISWLPKMQSWNLGYSQLPYFLGRYLFHSFFRSVLWLEVVSMEMFNLGAYIISQPSHDPMDLKILWWIIKAGYVTTDPLTGLRLPPIKRTNGSATWFLTSQKVGIWKISLKTKEDMSWNSKAFQEAIWKVWQAGRICKMASFSLVGWLLLGQVWAVFWFWECFS